VGRQPVPFTSRESRPVGGGPAAGPTRQGFQRFWRLPGERPHEELAEITLEHPPRQGPGVVPEQHGEEDVGLQRPVESRQEYWLDSETEQDVSVGEQLPDGDGGERTPPGLPGGEGVGGHQQPLGEDLPGQAQVLARQA